MFQIQMPLSLFVVFELLNFEIVSDFSIFGFRISRCLETCLIPATPG